MKKLGVLLVMNWAFSALGQDTRITQIDAEVLLAESKLHSMNYKNLGYSEPNQKVNLTAYFQSNEPVKLISKKTVGLVTTINEYYLKNQEVFFLRETVNTAQDNPRWEHAKSNDLGQEERQRASIETSTSTTFYFQNGSIFYTDLESETDPNLENLTLLFQFELESILLRFSQ